MSKTNVQSLAASPGKPNDYKNPKDFLDDDTEYPTEVNSIHMPEKVEEDPKQATFGKVNFQHKGRELKTYQSGSTRYSNY